MPQQPTSGRLLLDVPGWLKIRKFRFYNANYDEEMNNVSLCSTPFVAKLIEPEYIAALNKCDSYQYELVEADNEAVVKGTSSSNVVGLLDFSCGCEQAMTMRLPCRHAMAYRKHTGQSTVIPLKRIDVRWKRQDCVPKPVEAFVYNKSSRAHIEIVGIPRGATERYKEAMRLLQPICSELAEIEDESEFRAYVAFFQAQYRNLRKRKRIAVVEDDDAAPPTSLIKSDVASRPSDASEVGEGETEPTVCHVELSQTNSLYSADVGDVPPPVLRELHMSPLSELVAEDPGLAIFGDNLPVPGANQVDVGSGGASTQHADVSNRTEQVSPESASTAVQEIAIKLNEKAPRTGRPPNVRVEIEAEVRAERVRFNAAERVRQETGELSLKDVLDALDREEPDLTTTSQRLVGIMPKFAKYENNKPKYVRLPDPTLNEDCYYILPPKLLKACVDVLPLATRSGETIRVGTPDSQKPSNQDDDKLVEVVKIYSVDRVDAAENLIDKAAEGREFVKWLRIKIAPVLKTSLKPKVVADADKVEGLYPLARIPGLPDYTEFEVTALYRLRPPVWFNDGLISAFCARLKQAFAGVKLAGVLSLRQPAGRSRQPAPPFTDHLLAQMRNLMDQKGTTHVLVPVNFGDAHWTGVWINVATQEVKYYDSMTTTARRKVLESLTCSLIDEGVQACSEYTAVGMNSPIQFDGYSCGLFVCLRFWWDADRTVPRETSPTALELRRYEMVHFILHGDRP